MTIPERLHSRKFWLAVAGAILPIVGEACTGKIGWDKAVALAVGILVSYVLGQAYVDGKKEASGNGVSTPESANTAQGFKWPAYIPPTDLINGKPGC